MNEQPTGELLASLNRAGMSYSELGVRYGLTRNQVARKIQNPRGRTDTQARALFNVDYGQPLSLTGDFLIVGDVHVPCTDWDFAMLVPAVARKRGINQLIVAGDFMNMDFASPYPTPVPLPGWAQERDAARELIREYMKTFDHIYFIMGNHDRRLQRWAEGEFDEQDLFGMIIANPEKCTFSNWGYCKVNTNTEMPWRVTHSKAYRQIQLSMASDLALKYQCNIISHHEHHLAKGWDKYNRYVVINNGGLFDENKFAYVVLDDTPKPHMKNGFTSLQRGVATVYGKFPYTDWLDVLN